MKGFAWTCFAVFVILFLSLMAWATVAHFEWKIGCMDNLKLAADAPSPERALGFLEKALAFIEGTGKIAGNSSIIIKVPTNDLAIWVAQLRSARELLKNMIDSKASELERTNALMKIRETIIDQEESGYAITHPGNISIYPHQLIFWILFWVSLIGGGVFFVGVVALYQ